jgi:hypothetical protein
MKFFVDLPIGLIEPWSTSRTEESKPQGYPVIFCKQTNVEFKLSNCKPLS